jgi:hypothetical protein
MNLEIQDSDLKGFNAQARDKLAAVADTFVADLIAESNRVEATSKTTSGDAEITSSMVNDADVLLRRGLMRPKKRLAPRILRVVSAVLSLCVGIFYDAHKLQNSAYMFMFIAVITAAILCVTISTIQE